MWDVANVLIDLKQVIQPVNEADRKEGLKNLAWDSVASFVPFVPAGLSKVHFPNPKKYTINKTLEGFKVKIKEDFLAKYGRIKDEVVRYIRAGDKNVVVEGHEKAQAAKNLNQRIPAERVKPTESGFKDYKELNGIK